MALLKGTDDLSEFKGLAREAFGAQSLAHLQQQFLSSQPEPEQDKAVGILASFYAAAEDLRTSESAFNARARKQDTPDLKINLRSTEQFAAIKSFHQAKEQLLDLDPVNGRHIVSLVENSITASTRKSVKKAFANS